MTFKKKNEMNKNLTQSVYSMAVRYGKKACIRTPDVVLIQALWIDSCPVGYLPDKESG